MTTPITGTRWRDRALSSGQIPDPRRQGEPNTLDSVVRGFMRNDLLLSRPQIAHYVNTLVGNEAAEAIERHEAGVKEVAYWERVANNAPDAPPLARSQVRRSKAALEEADTADLESIGSVVGMLHRAKSVPFYPATCQQLVELDAQGGLSKYAGFDVTSVMAANPSHDPRINPPTPIPASERRRAAQSGRGVDFSRAPRPAQAQPQGPQRAAKPVPERRTRITPEERRREIMEREGITEIEPSRDPVLVSQAIDEILSEMRASRGSGEHNTHELG